MRWERRQPRWPLLAGLICLVALAIVAPFSWQHPLLNVHELMALQQEVAQIHQSLGCKETGATCSQETQALPARSAPSWDSFRDLCAAIEGIIDSLPQEFEQAISADEGASQVICQDPRVDTPLATPALPPQQTVDPPLPPMSLQPIVRVESASDRLAMLTPRRPVKLPMEQALPREVSETTALPATPLALSANKDLGRAICQKPETITEAAEFQNPLIRPRPIQLIKQLEMLLTLPATKIWSAQVLKCVRPLTDQTETSTEVAAVHLVELRRLVAEGKMMSGELVDPALQQLLLQAAEGCERRLSIWELLLADEVPSITAQDLQPSGTLMPVLGNVASLLAGTANGEAWREYLLLDQIAMATSEGTGGQASTRSKLAQEVLSRLHDPTLTAEQQAFIAHEPLASLERELQPWATGPVDLHTLLALIERYEAEGGLRYASAIAQLEQRMLWSKHEHLHALAEELHKSYHGANMRLAVSRKILNRMIPEQTVRTAPVRESIAGRRVHGRSRTTTEVEIALLPSDNAWKIQLQADGKVYSRTRSETWPVKVHNAARYEYEAKKVITIDGDGLQATRAKSSARGRNEFLGADSQFDRVPILGAMFRDLGKSQNQKSRPLAMSQVKAKVAYQARTRMDQEADPKLLQLEQQFRDRILAPFGNLALAAETVDMHTTKDRAVMELRLANLDQLAAHTPRPAAPADSLLSVQFHQTALNNALAGLELEGRRMTLLELHTLLAEKLGYQNSVPSADLPGRAIVEFAPYDAARVSFAKDRLELVLNIRELAHGRDKIPNFEVHTYHRPQVDGLMVNLVQEETLQFAGRNLRTGHRIILHSVFGKLFNKGEDIALLKRLDTDKRLAGLMVTQLVIDDGWLAMAIGPGAPERTAWRTPSYQFEADVR